MIPRSSCGTERRRPSHPWKEATIIAYRILIVEDDAAIRESVAALLQLDGHHVETVDGGQAALNLLAGRSYDVILSDVRMPGMDGTELYRHIEQRWPHLAPRVVLVTADESAGFQAQYGGAPVPTLTKPYTIERLQEVIARVIAQDS